MLSTIVNLLQWELRGGSRQCMKCGHWDSEKNKKCINPLSSASLGGDYEVPIEVCIAPWL